MEKGSRSFYTPPGFHYPCLLRVVRELKSAIALTQMTRIFHISICVISTSF